MVLVFVLSLATALSAVVSLLDSHGTLRKLRSGKASYLELADYTDVLDRDQLARLPGVFEDSSGNLGVDPTSVAQLPRSRLFHYSILADLAALALSLLAAGINTRLADSNLVWMVLLPAMAYEVGSWVWAAFRVVRNIDSVVR